MDDSSPRSLELDHHYHYLSRWPASLHLRVSLAWSLAISTAADSERSLHRSLAQAVAVGFANKPGRPKAQSTPKPLPASQIGMKVSRTSRRSIHLNQCLISIRPDDLLKRYGPPRHSKARAR